MSRADSWLPYYRWLLWGPVVIGFVLPFVIHSLDDPAFVIDLAKESDELILMIFGALICDIPFFIVAHFTRRDKKRNMSLKKGLRDFAVRSSPVFLLYALLLFDVERSRSSTAPIAILFVQPIAILLVFITNWVLRQVTDIDDAPIST